MIQHLPDLTHLWLPEHPKDATLAFVRVLNHCFKRMNFQLLSIPLPQDFDEDIHSNSAFREQLYFNTQSNLGHLSVYEYDRGTSALIPLLLPAIKTLKSITVNLISYTRRYDSHILDLLQDLARIPTLTHVDIGEVASEIMADTMHRFPHVFANFIRSTPKIEMFILHWANAYEQKMGLDVMPTVIHHWTRLERFGIIAHVFEIRLKLEHFNSMAGSCGETLDTLLLPTTRFSILKLCNLTPSFRLPRLRHLQLLDDCTAPSDADDESRRDLLEMHMPSLVRYELDQRLGKERQRRYLELIRWLGRRWRRGPFEEGGCRAWGFETLETERILVECARD
ncbi:MAG: hypothetical protein Q9162_003538 [Coniocarpon cinnabarinum]